jgi:aladin
MNNFHLIFSSTVGNIFRIWNTENWNSERWTIANGHHVQSFQWSPCSRFLLFITSDDPVLYCLGFADEPLFNVGRESREIQQPKRALPVADLSKISLEHIEVGGNGQQIAWNGKYLAISFKDTNAIAVFQTSVQHHQMHILAMFFIAGIGFEFPNFITFQPNYKAALENVLTIGWSSGRIQFFPFV